MYTIKDRDGGPDDHADTMQQVEHRLPLYDRAVVTDEKGNEILRYSQVRGVRFRDPFDLSLVSADCEADK